MKWWHIMAALSAILFPCAGGAATAQTIVSSSGPERVAVTVYRNPQRSAAEAPNLRWLGGYALISETRQISIPAGESEIRFEGVAGGIEPQSAIVTGFPEGIVERNRDAYLLSPGTLLDRSLGRRVMIRRTSTATGQVRETEAVIRSGADGAVVLQTAEGFETLRCTGLPEALIYNEVPSGLSPRPTLSVRARSSRAVTATVTLIYLATGFDWRANYIAQLSADGRRVDLFAWLTLASTDETSFANADAQAVAGQLNRADHQVQPRAGGPLNLRCWGANNNPISGVIDARGFDDAIVVTGTRMRSANLASTTPVAVITAEQENLGDLKLYRIPEPVTIAANSQKQVALMTRPGVRVDLVWRTELTDQEAGPLESLLTLRTRNRSDRGLGLPLPAGGVTLFRDYQGRPVMIGEAAIDDRAVEEKVEMNFPAPPSLNASLEVLEREDDRVVRRLVVRNAADHAIDYEALLPNAEEGQYRFSRRVRREDGRWIWRTRIPANGTASIEWGK
jgi:hypothetical protein